MHRELIWIGIFHLRGGSHLERTAPNVDKTIIEALPLRGESGLSTGLLIPRCSRFGLGPGGFGFTSPRITINGRIVLNDALPIGLGRKREAQEKQESST